MKYEKPEIQDLGVIGDHTFMVPGKGNKGGSQGPKANDPFGEGATGSGAISGGSPGGGS